MTKQKLQAAVQKCLQEIQATNDIEIALIAEAERMTPIQVQNSRSTIKAAKKTFTNIRSKFNQNDFNGITKKIVTDSADHSGSTTKIIHNQSKVEDHIIQ